MAAPESAASTTTVLEPAVILSERCLQTRNLKYDTTNPPGNEAECIAYILLGERGSLFAPMLHNTVNATIVRGGEKINVILSEIVIELDGRLLPGYKPADLIRELHAPLGRDLQLEVIRYDEGPAEADMGLFDVLASVMREADPAGIPLPYMLTGVTDGRFFSRLGIQTYGFTPLKLPPGFPIARLAHAADEHVPVEAIKFGAQTMYKVLQRYGAAA